MVEEIKQGHVKVEREHGIATIEFFHPQGNSLPGQLLRALAKHIHSEGLNKENKVIVLRSGGEKIFCSGASFDELAAIGSQEQGNHFFSGFAEVINAMRKTPQFIIARIQGKCIGGGVGLAAAADYAIATDGADIKLSELAVGIGPFVVGPAVQRKIGLAAFSEMTIDAGTWRHADWARRKGLFSEIHSSTELMDDAIIRLANTLSHSSPEAMYEIKKMLWQGTEHWDQLLTERAAISGRLILGDHSRQFIASFKAKQKP
ncbi:enoyl-CoA hydratase/isomerase family protein [Sediminibacterium soli]|uniref:enoyl-CoA hydratase/isomerase family protein n=1 Tax=Sediminibacterium soli TaxID=2698829 RepID=UPI001379E063|nr:enoyl-CoA hydratase/isomerase family protein [Sediminibacterium soli]NCI45115.1 enoyl-CoA hydratase/isomerase family protein [Sediminibacterium soli]